MIDTLSFAEYLLKEIRARIASRSETVAHGQTKDWESYQRVVGEITGLTLTENSIKDLLKRMERANDE